MSYSLTVGDYFFPTGESYRINGFSSLLYDRFRTAVRAGIQFSRMPCNMRRNRQSQKQLIRQK